MKKILATILALTMIVGMSITAFAANFTEMGATQDIEVNATYEKTDATTDDTAVYSVNITWTDISFHFTEAANVKTWDPAKLEYVVTTEKTDGVWSGATATISLENRSNAPVVVTPTWDGEVDDVQPVISGPVRLDAATEGADAGVTGEITVAAPTSGKIAAAGKLGTITLTITAAPQ